MSKFQLGLKVQNKANGEIGTIVAGPVAERIYMDFVSGVKDYTLSTSTRNFKLMPNIVTETVIVENIENIEEVAVTENQIIEEEFIVENNNGSMWDEENEEVTIKTGSTEEEKEFLAKIEAQGLEMELQAKKDLEIARVAKEVADAKEEIEKTEKEKAKVEKTPKAPKAPKAPKEPKVPTVDNRAMYVKMVNSIMETMKADNSFENVTYVTLNDNGYGAVKIKANFAKFIITSKKLDVTVLPLPVLPTTDLKIKVVPDSFHWAMTTTMTVTKEDEMEEVLRIIKLSYIESVKASNKPAKVKKEKVSKVKKPELTEEIIKEV